MTHAKDKTFRDSVVPVVRLKPDETCSIKRHFRNVLREVIGYLDKLASNDAERFVWASVPDITRHCNKFRKEKEPYGQRQVEYAIEIFRELRTVSKPVERVRLGVKRSGFIVAPHDGQYATFGKECRFVQFRGRWKSSGPGGAIWWDGKCGE